jgi:hypothetical protein
VRQDTTVNLESLTRALKEQALPPRLELVVQEGQYTTQFRRRE